MDYGAALMVRIWLDNRLDALVFEVPREHVNRMLQSYEPITQFGAQLLAAEVIREVVGVEQFMFLGYAAVMREALSEQA